MFHPVGQLFLHGVGDEPGGGILADDTYDVGEVSGFVGAGVAPIDEKPPRERPAAEMGDQAVDDTEKCGLAHPGSSDDQRQLPFIDAQIDVS